jgi:hypothetical protein
MAENYGFNVFDLLRKYNEHIYHVINFTHDEIKKFADDYACLAIHDSYPDKEIKSKLVAVFRKKKKPVIIFSEQFPKTTFDAIHPTEFITGIKKSRFYLNLSYFLAYFVEKNQLKLNVLSLGKRYNRKRAGIIRDQLIKYSVLNIRNFDFNQIIPIESDDKRKEELYKAWEELYFLAKPNDNKEHFINFDDKCRESLEFDFFNFEKTINEIVKNVNDE